MGQEVGRWSVFHLPHPVILLVTVRKENVYLRNVEGRLSLTRSRLVARLSSPSPVIVLPIASRL